MFSSTHHYHVVSDHIFCLEYI